MKNNPNFKVLAALFLLMIASCQQDDFEVNSLQEAIPEAPQSSLRLQMKPFEAVEELPALYKELVTDKNRFSNTGLTTSAYDPDITNPDLYNFTIDSTRVGHISNEFGDFYTMYIKRDTPSNGYYENIMIANQKFKEPKAYLFKYYLNGEQGIQELEYERLGFASWYQDGSGNYCVTWTEMVCTYQAGEDNDVGPSCEADHIEERTHTVCTASEEIAPDDGNGGGGSTGGGLPNNDQGPQGNGNGAGGSSGGSTPDDPNDPGCEIDLITGENSCDVILTVDISPRREDLITRLLEKLNLNADQVDWLLNVADYDILEDTLIFLEENEDSLESKASALITIDTFRNDLQYLPFGDDFFDIYNRYAEEDVIDPNLTLKLAAYLTFEMITLKQENPEWRSYKIFFTAVSEAAHLGLDILGFFPLFGNFADITNGIIYAVEGDGLNATLSVAAAIPVAGWWVTGAKWAKKGVTLVDGSKTTYKWVIKTNDLIDFGRANSTRFRKAIGLLKRDARQAHHIIPRGSSILKDDVVQQAARHGLSPFHIDEAFNGVAVAAWRNQPNHNTYNNRILERLDLFKRNNPNFTPEQAHDFLDDFIVELRGLIQSNPNTHLNDLIF